MTAPLAILGWGTALPEHAIAQEAAASLALALAPLAGERSRLIAPLYRRSGVRRRHSVLIDHVNGAVAQSFFTVARGAQDFGPTTRERMKRYANEAPVLALQAAETALATSGRSASEITHLITISCTGFGAPGFDVELIRNLQLSAQVARTHVGFMGCHGALNGLRVAAAFGALDPNACILLCAVELCSLHFQYGGEANQVVANALFADGAAALVASPALPGNASNQAGSPWRVMASGSCIFPETEDAMTWSIGDHGFAMTLSPRVPELIRSTLKPWLVAWLAQSNLTINDIATWAIHPGGPRILQAVESALDLPGEATAVSRAVLAECGNMSSPTILFILDRLARANAPRPCVALGFGPGLAVETTLFG